MLTDGRTDITNQIGPFHNFTNDFTKHFSTSDGPDKLWGQINLIRNGKGEGYSADNRGCRNEADLSTGSAVKNAWSHISIPPTEAVIY